MKKDLTNESSDIVYNKPRIKVIGLGGGGGNAIDRILRLGYAVEDVEFIAANTDLQALELIRADTKLLLGPALTGGLGSGGKPEVGEQAALESKELLREALEGADIVFLTAGMGGGTGSGAISVAAHIAHELGAITVSIVSTPFSFEAGRRITNARNSLTKLAANSDTLITIPNDQLLKVTPKNTTLREAFAYADDVLRQGIIGIASLLTTTGLMNVDFAYVRELMQNGGGSILSIGYGKGPDKVSSALYQALNHPLLEHLPIENATGIIANFTGNENLSFDEVMHGMSYLQQLANNRADIVPGQIVDPNMTDDEVQIILIITGIASIPVETVQQETPEEDFSHRTTVFRTREEAAPAPKVPEEPIQEVEEELQTEPVQLEEEISEEVPEMAYTASEEKPTEAAAEENVPAFVTQSRIYPTVEEPRFQVSPAADAAYNTFMEPLGLSGTDAAPMQVESRSFRPDIQDDLDVPTFIRRRL